MAEQTHGDACPDTTGPEESEDSEGSERSHDGAHRVEGAAGRQRSRHPLPLWRHMLGAGLRRLRHQRGDTLGEIASRAGVSPQYLSEMERGVKDPSSEMIEAVAGALGVTLVDLAIAVAGELGAVQSRDVRASTVRSSMAVHPRGVDDGAPVAGSPAVVLLATHPQATLALAA